MTGSTHFARFSPRTTAIDGVLHDSYGHAVCTTAIAVLPSTSHSHPRSKQIDRRGARGTVAAIALFAVAGGALIGLWGTDLVPQWGFIIGLLAGSGLLG